MGSVANLSDIMLVFACGLMVAIVAFWNIDLDNIDKIRNQEDGFEIKGDIYQDPETGTIYLIPPSDAEASDTDATKAGATDETQ
ncbi:MAG: DUF2149 domain-containing protein [Oscillospiraceae bacterium]|nr:DUF2149 domain-containing protein [Oscillospiraceae bacterium]